MGLIGVLIELGNLHHITGWNKSHYEVCVDTYFVKFSLAYFEKKSTLLTWVKSNVSPVILTF